MKRNKNRLKIILLSNLAFWISLSIIREKWIRIRYEGVRKKSPYSWQILQTCPSNSHPRTPVNQNNRDSFSHQSQLFNNSHGVETNWNNRKHRPQRYSSGGIDKSLPRLIKRTGVNKIPNSRIGKDGKQGGEKQWLFRTRWIPLFQTGRRRCARSRRYKSHGWAKTFIRPVNPAKSFYRARFCPIAWPRIRASQAAIIRVIASPTHADTIHRTRYDKREDILTIIHGYTSSSYFLISYVRANLKSCDEV